MRADPSSISQAFREEWHAYAYIASVFFFLLLPVLLIGSSRLSVWDAFSAADPNYGYHEHNYKEIYERTSDVDILFLGGCLITDGIDEETFQQQLSEKYPGVKKNIVILGRFRNGADVDYFLLKEIIKRRKVKLVVFQTPFPTLRETRNENSVIWLTAQDQEMLGELSPFEKARLYDQSVIMGLRDLLSLIRPNLRSEFPIPGDINNRPSTVASEQQGPPQGPTSPKACHQAIPSTPTDKYFFETNPNGFVFEGEPPGETVVHYLNKSIALLRDNHIPLVALTLPPLVPQSERVSQSVKWPTLTGGYAHLTGISSSDFLKGLTSEQQHLLYADDRHLSPKGAIFFTKTIFEPLIHATNEFPSKTTK